MTETTETGLPRVIAIAWGMQEVPQRGPSRGLSHERIITAAVEIADAHGLGAVTMQAVAKSLGFTTMSLYRYVSGKDELLRLMQDHAFQLPADVTLSADWRSALKEWTKLLRDVHRSRPWALDIPRTHVSVLMPNSARAADLGLQAMSDLRIDDDEKVAVILTLSQHAASAAELEIALAKEESLAVTSEGEAMLAEAITPQHFPALAPLMRADGFVPVSAKTTTGPVPEGKTTTTTKASPSSPSEQQENVDDEFDFAIDLIIAGLEVLERRREQERTE